MNDRYKDILEDTQEQNENVEQMQDESNIIPDPTAPIDFTKSSNGTAPTSPTFDDKTSEDVNNMKLGMSMGNVIFKNQGPNLEDTEVERRRQAQDQAMGDVRVESKGIKGAIEKFKTRNDLVSYSYETDDGGTRGVTTTRKKIIKEQKAQSTDPASTESKSTKSIKINFPSKKPKGIYLKKGKQISQKKHLRRRKKLGV